jgi:hypothetical protein
MAYRVTAREVQGTLEVDEMAATPIGAGWAAPRHSYLAMNLSVLRRLSRKCGVDLRQRIV